MQYVYTINIYINAYTIIYTKCPVYIYGPHISNLSLEQLCIHFIYIFATPYDIYIKILYLYVNNILCMVISNHEGLRSQYPSNIYTPIPTKYEVKLLHSIN